MAACSKRKTSSSGVATTTVSPVWSARHVTAFARSPHLLSGLGCTSAGTHGYESCVCQCPKVSPGEYAYLPSCSTLHNPFCRVVERAPMPVDAFNGDKCTLTVLRRLQRSPYRESQRVDTALELGTTILASIHGPLDPGTWGHKRV